MFKTHTVGAAFGLDFYGKSINLTGLTGRTHIRKIYEALLCEATDEILGRIGVMKNNGILRSKLDKARVTWTEKQ